MLNELELLKNNLVVVETNNVYLTNCSWLARSNEMVNTGPAGRPKLKSYFVYVLVVLWSICCTNASGRKPREKIYTNGWAVKVSGGFENAKIVAKRHGFEKVEKV